MPYVVKEDRPHVGVVEHVVMRLMEPYHKTGQNVTTDNYFTSLKTAKNLLQHNITMVGTLLMNKKEIPAELHVETRHQPLYASRLLFTQDDGIMILYCKAKQKKDIFLFSSMHIAPVVNDHDAKNKPEAILYYNATKGGVDNADEMLQCYNTKSASRRWPSAAFFNLLDIIYLNLFVIAKDIRMTHGSRRDFL